MYPNFLSESSWRLNRVYFLVANRGSQRNCASKLSLDTGPNRHVHFAKRTRSLCQTNTFTLPNEHVHFAKRIRSLCQADTFTFQNGHVRFSPSLRTSVSQRHCASKLSLDTGQTRRFPKHAQLRMTIRPGYLVPGSTSATIKQNLKYNGKKWITVSLQPLGPSSDTEATWQAMLAAGATAFRLNTSHLTLPQLHTWLDRLGAFLSSVDPTPPLVLDLQGSKWRLGQFPAFELEGGQRVELVCAPAADRPHVLPVPHVDFFRAASVSGGEIVLNDAKVRLVMESSAPDSITARVTQGGEIVSRKGITYASSTYRQESLNPKDRGDPGANSTR